MRKTLILLATLLANTHVFAETNNEATALQISGCAKIENSVNRLSCFDGLSKKAEVLTPAPEEKGQWNVNSETSKINDSTNVWLTLESENEFAGKYGSAAHSNIYIACREGKTHFYISMGNHFLADNQSFGTVTMRVDKAKAREISMQESTDNGALGLWNGSGIKFMKTLFGAKRLLARVTPYNESAIDAEFNISGLETAIKPLRNACKW